MIEEKVKFKSFGYELAGIVNIPQKTPAPGIILFHGLTNSKEDCPLIKECTEMLVHEGYVVLRFDFFGSGESPGKLKDKRMSVLEQNAKDAVNFLAKDSRVDGKIGVWGRSLGGTTSLLLSGDPRIKAFVSASGAVYLEKVLGRKTFLGLKQIEEKLSREGRVLPGTGKYKGQYELERSWFEELDDYDKKIQECLKKLGCVLVLATTPDKKVPLEHATAIMNAAREPKEIHIFEGTEHDYKGVENEAVRLVTEWFRKYL